MIDYCSLVIGNWLLNIFEPQVEIRREKAELKNQNLELIREGRLEFEMVW